jgi:hypothetical protein
MFIPIGIPFFNVHPHFIYFGVGMGLCWGALKIVIFKVTH